MDRSTAGLLVLIGGLVSLASLAFSYIDFWLFEFSGLDLFENAS